MESNLQFNAINLSIAKTWIKLDSSVEYGPDAGA